jgi:hypothetical protein
VAQLVLIGPTSEYTRKLQETVMSFERLPAQLHDFLNPPVPSAQEKIFNFITPVTATLLGSIKVNQALQASPSYGRDGGYIFIRLSTLLRLQAQVIQAFRKPETSLLIVECKPQEKSVDNLYCALSNLLLNAENKRLLLIAPANDPFVEKFNGHFSAHEQEKIQVVDVTRFNDLTPASQRALLKTSINFQGQPALLSQLLGINDLNQMTSKALDAFDAVIDPSTLAQMIKKEPIALGGEPLRFSQLEVAYAKLYKPIEPQNLVDNLVKIQDLNVLFMISSSD